jgi:hypothetical protein
MCAKAASRHPKSFSHPASGFGIPTVSVAMLLFKSTSLLAVFSSKIKPTSISAIASSIELSVTHKAAPW